MNFIRYLNSQQYVIYKIFKPLNAVERQKFVYRIPDETIGAMRMTAFAK